MNIRSLIPKCLHGPARVVRTQARLYLAKAFPWDGAYSRKYWTARSDDDRPLAEFYWSTRTWPTRSIIADVVTSLSGDSILEIGCQSGPNLWAIAQRTPSATLAGTELSPSALAFAKETFPHAIDRAVDLCQAAADALPFHDESFDIVLASGLLLCIGPESIDQSLDEIYRVCRHWLVICETRVNQDRLDVAGNTTYWLRNYDVRLAGRFTRISTTMFPIDARIGHTDNATVYAKKRPRQ